VIVAVKASGPPPVRRASYHLEVWVDPSLMSPWRLDIWEANRGASTIESFNQATMWMS